MSRSALVKELEKLSLRKHEAAIYLELLSLGASNAGPIIRATGLHRQIVYGALSGLEDAGLVSVTVFNNRKVFQATPPSNLISLQQERERLARRLAPQLAALEPKNQDRLAIQTASGTAEFFRSIVKSLEVAATGDRIVRVIGGARSEAFYEALGDRYEAYVEACNRLKITKYLLTSARNAKYFKERFAKEKRTVLKLLDEGLSSPTYTRITSQLVTLEVYGAQPTVIQLWNRAIASGYLEHFQLLWARARAF